MPVSESIAAPSNVLFAQAEAIKKFMSASSQIVAAVEYQPEPLGWSGDIFDQTGVSSVFNRDEPNDVVDTVTRTDGSGNACDLNLSMLQGSLLSCMERAFRTKNSSAVRRRAHTAGVQAGHGSDAGIWTRGLESYINGIKKLGSKPGAS